MSTKGLPCQSRAAARARRIAAIWTWCGLTTNRPSFQKASSPSRESGYRRRGRGLEPLAQPDDGPRDQVGLDPVLGRGPDAVEHADHQRVVGVDQGVGQLVDAASLTGLARSSRRDGDLGRRAPVLGRVDLLGRVGAERPAHPPVLEQRRGEPAVRVLGLQALEERAVQDRLARLGVGIRRLDDRRELLVVAGDQQARPGLQSRPARSTPRGRGAASPRRRRRGRPGPPPRPCGSTRRCRRAGRPARRPTIASRSCPALGGMLRTPSIPASRVSSSLRIGNVAADDPVSLLELGRLAEGVVDGRVGEGGQERPERPAGRRGAPRPGRAPPAPGNGSCPCRAGPRPAGGRDRRSPRTPRAGSRSSRASGPAPGPGGGSPDRPPAARPPGAAARSGRRTRESGRRSSSARWARTRSTL